MSRLLSILFVLLSAGCSSLQGPPAVSTNVGASSQYVFRGVPQNAKGVVQADATVAFNTYCGGVASGTAWGNVDLDDDTGDAVFVDGNGGDLSEFDVIVDYARTFGAVSASVGVSNYNFPNFVGRSTTEVYAGASLADAPLAPSLTAYYDVDQVTGLYLSGAIGHGFALSERWNLALGLTLGYADDDQAAFYFFGADGGLTDLLASAALTYGLSDSSSLTATLGHAWLIDSDVKDAVDAAGIDTENLVLAIGYGWSR